MEWYIVYVHGTWYVVHGTWYMVYGESFYSLFLGAGCLLVLFCWLLYNHNYIVLIITLDILKIIIPE